MSKKSTSIENSFAVSGIGLHSGLTSQVQVKPAVAGEGRYFVRVDLPGKPAILATVEAVNQTTLSTELGLKFARVRTVEHLLAALIGSGVDNARIEIDSSEVPLLDGSAKPWVEAIAAAGICQLEGEEEKKVVSLQEPIWIREGDAFVAAVPASATRFTYGIDFDYEAIGNQWYSWSPDRDSFPEAIAPARTFGFAEEIEKLRNLGLIKGGTLANALVCSRSGWVNPPLRFANEPVRHKLLDLLGDLSLLETIPMAHFLAYKASHKLHIQLAKALNDQIYTAKIKI